MLLGMGRGSKTLCCPGLIRTLLKPVLYASLSRDHLFMSIAVCVEGCLCDSGSCERSCVGLLWASGTAFKQPVAGRGSCTGKMVRFPAGSAWATLLACWVCSALAVGYGGATTNGGGSSSSSSSSPITWSTNVWAGVNNDKFVRTYGKKFLAGESRASRRSFGGKLRLNTLRQSRALVPALSISCALHHTLLTIRLLCLRAGDKSFYFQGGCSCRACGQQPAGAEWAGHA